MKKSLIFTLSLIFIGALQAEPPKKRTMAELSRLWQHSSFTTPTEEEQKNQLEDWALVGVSSNPQGGYMVTIVHKKNRAERRRVHSSGKNTEESAQGFQILEVSQSGLNYKETKVKLSVDGQEGWVVYDDKLLEIKPSAPAPKKLAPKPQVATPAPTQPLPNLTPTDTNQDTPTPASRRPRIRRVPPTPN